MKINRAMHAIIVLLFTSWASFGQAKHTVAKGETVTQIAQKYRITPFDIYKLNPDAQAGIKENDVLLIPSGAQVAVTKPVTKATTHTAKPKETLFSISRQYGVSVDEIVAANPVLSQGLKIGQTIKIPASGGTGAAVETTPVAKPTPAPAITKVTKTTTTGNVSYHVVEPKETKFGIAKKYGMTVAELEQRNPGIEKNLPIGYKLVVSGSGATETHTEIVEKPVAKTPEQQPAATTTTEPKNTKFSGYANYEVKPKETIFSLTQMFGISEKELMTLNPQLKDGLKEGMILKVPGRGSVIAERTDATTDLTKKISSREKKQLVLMLPFNASKIQGDSLKSVAERLKKDAFLNMTLDFYAGALVAIDSAKTLGMNIDVKIYDSEESKANSNVASLIQGNNFKEVDAVIGPFYQQHAERAAELLDKADVPVISPLSKESGKPYANLYQAMPSTDVGRMAVLDYMMRKNGNIIIVNDPKRTTSKEFIARNCPEAQFVGLDDIGNISIESLKSLLVKDRQNFIVLDTEKTGMILSTTNLLLNEMANFQLQLAILEANETLDYDEISMKRLTILKLLYPSMTRENNSAAASAFENHYKRDNKIFPSQYAVRGFDVTFDTMLRLSQDKPFNQAAIEKTEQVESKFAYTTSGEGFVNKGVYVLEYQEDLSVKEAQ
ncbi:LysM peptidoglycan-binding domain-containing protein [Flavobacterium longum]|uniref:LysM peptidoglycan-binding domain-containing protein n=1 Tax=Flavobacterium longum TaxID=1299340 RepID=UPI0039EAD2EA